MSTFGGIQLQNAVPKKDLPSNNSKIQNSHMQKNPNAFQTSQCFLSHNMREYVKCQVFKTNVTQSQQVFDLKQQCTNCSLKRQDDNITAEFRCKDQFTTYN